MTTRYFCDSCGKKTPFPEPRSVFIKTKGEKEFDLEISLYDGPRRGFDENKYHMCKDCIYNLAMSGTRLP